MPFRCRRARFSAGLAMLLCLLYLPAPVPAVASHAPSVASACAPGLQAYSPTMGPMRGIAAAGVHDVWIAGSSADGVEQPLLLHGDGARFTSVPVSVPAALLPARLSALAASAPTDVWAIGASSVPAAYTQSGGQPLVVHYDGARWSLGPFPSLGALGGTLTALSVLSARDVWVAGSRPADQRLGATAPLLAHWDGARWTQARVPASPALSALAAVVALSGSNIWAAGGSPNSPAIAHFDGHAWRVFSGFAGLPLGAQALTGLAAVSPTDIWAVGNYDASNINRGGAGPVTLHWNGRAWHIIHSANTPGSAANNVRGVVLNSVVALSSDNVWAAGDGIEHWDGSRWRIVAATGRTVTAMAGFGRHLWAAEIDYAGAKALAAEAVQRWDGAAWHTLYSPPPSFNPQESVQSLAELTPRDLWAVGTVDSTATSSAYPEPLLVHGDGAAWQRQPVVSVPGRPAAYAGPLLAVAGSGPSDVWALSGSDARHWDGRRWSIIPGALPTGVNGQLHAVAALAPDDAWAVGSAGTGAPGLVMHWDGARWGRVPSPGGVGSTALYGVTALSGRLAWAVGELHFTRQRPVSKLWDGARWRDVPVPNFGPSVEGWLNAVAVVSPRDAWAAGVALVTDPVTGLEGATTALLEHWDGTRWTYVPLPGRQSRMGGLTAMTAISARDVWAAGSGIAHWDGLRWRLMDGPMPAATYTALSAGGPSDVWVAGTAPSNGDAAFLAHWNGHCWNVTRVP